MIQLTPHMRILVATRALDFRSGIDGVAYECKARLAEDPMSGTIFVFTNRTRKMIRLLMYDGQGYWLATKRLSSGRFPWWPKANGEMTVMQAHEIQILIQGGDCSQVRVLKPWKKIADFEKKLAS
jgi:transposase